MSSNIKALFILLVSLSISVQAQTDPNIFEKFESKFYTIDGYKINVEVLGEGDPIFFYLADQETRMTICKVPLVIITKRTPLYFLIG